MEDEEGLNSIYSYPDVDLTEEQISEVKEAFSLFDKTCEGNIASSDMEPIMKALGRNPSIGTINEMIMEADSEGNGTITFGDFIVLMEKKFKEENTEEDVRDAFRRFDPDNNGYILATEARHVILNMGEKFTEEEVDEILVEAEIDIDGVVNYEVLVTMLMPH